MERVRRAVNRAPLRMPGQAKHVRLQPGISRRAVSIAESNLSSPGIRRPAAPDRRETVQRENAQGYGRPSAPGDVGGMVDEDIKDFTAQPWAAHIVTIAGAPPARLEKFAREAIRPLGPR